MSLLDTVNKQYIAEREINSFSVFLWILSQKLDFLIGVWYNRSSTVRDSKSSKGGWSWLPQLWSRVESAIGLVGGKPVVFASARTGMGCQLAWAWVSLQTNVRNVSVL